MGRPDRVSFKAEMASEGLRLCLSDMNKDNFLKDRNNNIVVIDYGVTCFLPISFFNLALLHHDPFTARIRSLIGQPQSEQLNALIIAKYSLIPFGTNDVAEQISFHLQRSRMKRTV
jgi:hypothetical protein